MLDPNLDVLLVEDDPVTRRLLEDILKDTEEHARDLEALLGE